MTMEHNPKDDYKIPVRKGKAGCTELPHCEAAESGGNNAGVSPREEAHSDSLQLGGSNAKSFSTAAHAKILSHEAREQTLVSRLQALQEALSTKDKTVLAQQETLEMQRQEIMQLENSVATLVSQVAELKEALTMQRPGGVSMPTGMAHSPFYEQCEDDQPHFTNDVAGRHETSEQDQEDGSRETSAFPPPMERSASAPRHGQRRLRGKRGNSCGSPLKTVATGLSHKGCSTGTALTKHTSEINKDQLSRFMGTDESDREARSLAQLSRMTVSPENIVRALELEASSRHARTAHGANRGEDKYRLHALTGIISKVGTCETNPVPEDRIISKSEAWVEDNDESEGTASLSEAFALQDEALLKWLQLLVEILECERGTIFLWDPLNKELFSRCATGGLRQPIRVKCNSGIAGVVFTSGKSLIVHDAYADQRFNPVIDKRTKFQTKNICCVPIAFRGKTIGCFQLLNKLRGLQFGIEETEFLGLLSCYLGHAFTYMPLVDDTEAMKAAVEISASLALQNELHGPLHTNVTHPVAHWLARGIAAALEAEHCTFWLTSATRKEPLLTATTVDFENASQQPRSALASRVLEYGTTINIVDASKDERFDDNAEWPCPPKTRTLLCLPLLCPNQDVDQPPRGCVQIFNKLNGGIFSTSDMKKLQCFAPVIYGQYEEGRRALSLSCAFTYLRSICSNIPVAAFLVDPAGGKRRVLRIAKHSATVKLYTRLHVLKGMKSSHDVEGLADTDHYHTTSLLIVCCLPVERRRLPDHYDMYEMWTACVSTRREITRQIQFDAQLSFDACKDDERLPCDVGEAYNQNLPGRSACVRKTAQEDGNDEDCALKTKSWVVRLTTWGLPDRCACLEDYVFHGGICTTCSGPHTIA